MSSKAKSEEKNVPAVKDLLPQKTPTSPGLLFEQYKMLEERRKYFGNQFMQTIGGVAAIVSVLVGQLSGKNQNETLLRLALVCSGFAFILVGYLSLRLGMRQDDCERVMNTIEISLRSMEYPVVATMPPGAKGFGARRAIVCFLAAVGVTLVVAGFVKW